MRRRANAVYSIPDGLMTILRANVPIFLVGDVSCAGFDATSNKGRSGGRLIDHMPDEVLSRWLLRYNIGVALIRKRLVETRLLNRLEDEVRRFYDDREFEIYWLRHVCAVQVYLWLHFRGKLTRGEVVSLKNVVAAMTAICVGRESVTAIDTGKFWDEFAASYAIFSDVVTLSDERSEYAPVLALDDDVGPVLTMITNVYAKNYPMYEDSTMQSMLRILADQDVESRKFAQFIEQMVGPGA